MNALFDILPERHNTYSTKWDAVDGVFSGKDLLPFWVADMDFVVAGGIRQALQDRVSHGVVGYTRRMDDFYDAVVLWCKIRHGWSIQREWISYSPGVLTGIALAVEAFTKPDEQIMMHTPIYYPFFKTVAGRGRRVLESRLLYRSGGSFEIDFESMKRLDRGTTRTMILCNPHNPTGRVWQERELQGLAEYAIDRELLMLSDDIHSDIVYSGNRYRPIASVNKEMLDRTITFLSPSKGFNLAGLKTSVLIIPNETLRTSYNRLLESFHLDGAGVFGTIALIAAYTRCEDWLERLVAYLEENVHFVDGYLRQSVPEVKLVDPEGTFIPLLDIGACGMSDTAFCQMLVEKGKVALEPGSWFGSGGERFVRINIGTSRELLRSCMDAIRKGIRP